MEKKDIKRPDYTDRTIGDPPVPEIRAEAKNGEKHKNPVVTGTNGTDMKVCHNEKPISDVYAVIDNDLARDNIENDMTEADLQGLD